MIYEHFTRVAEKIDVTPLLAQLDAHPELWNRHGERLCDPASPHRETDDLWIRYRRREELTSPQAYAEPHESVWYPAADALPSLRPIATRLWEAVGAEQLGGVLMTRIGPGKQVYPHHDRGTWHAEHYTDKVWMPLRANPQCWNFCEDEGVVMKAGDAWTFSNLKEHSVLNWGQTERIVLICCFRCGE